MSSCMNETVSDIVFIGKGHILRMISPFFFFFSLLVFFGGVVVVVFVIDFENP